MKPTVSVERNVTRDPVVDTVPQTVCTIEGNGVGPFRLYFSDDVSSEDISQALRLQAMVLANGRSLPLYKRARVARLYEEASKNVPNLKERG